MPRKFRCISFSSYFLFLLSPSLSPFVWSLICFTLVPLYLSLHSFPIHSSLSFRPFSLSFCLTFLLFFIISPSYFIIIFSSAASHREKRDPVPTFHRPLPLLLSSSQRMHTHELPIWYLFRFPSPFVAPKTEGPADSDSCLFDRPSLPLTVPSSGCRPEDILHYGFPAPAKQQILFLLFECRFLLLLRFEDRNISDGLLSVLSFRRGWRTVRILQQNTNSLFSLFFRIYPITRARLDRMTVNPNPQEQFWSISSSSQYFPLSAILLSGFSRCVSWYSHERKKRAEYFIPSFFSRLHILLFISQTVLLCLRKLSVYQLQILFHAAVFFSFHFASQIL